MISTGRMSLFLMMLIVLVVAISLMIGNMPLSMAQVWAGLWSQQGDAVETLVIQQIRLPRTLLALLVGGSLGLAGAALQTYLRNPLAEPGLLGVSNGAALGAVIALYGGWVARDSMGLPIAAMLGALVAVMLTGRLAGKTGNAAALVLAGVAVSSLLGALVAVVLNLVPNPFAAMEVIFWLMGSVADRTLDQVTLVLVPSLIGWALILSCMRGLSGLALGERTAISMGIALGKLQWRLALGIALAVGSGVAIAGSIGFIGLVVPHLLRPWVGHAPARLLPASTLAGAVLLLLADIAVRLIPTSGMELRLGVVTALLGAPYFVVLLMKLRGGEGYGR